MRRPKRIPLIVLFLVGIATLNPSLAQEPAQAKTVIGPTNPNLADGAKALRLGKAEQGVRLTRLGLAAAQGRRERQAALSNLCAGYVLLEQYDTALTYCDSALKENERNWRAYNNRALAYVKLKRFEEAEADILRGQELQPNAWSLKVVKGMLLDETQPVAPNIVIDDRQGPDGDET
jgi:tetratricopeptide (TPR) repeat protein